MKNKILKIAIFFLTWGIIYWITASNFWFISLLFAYLLVYSIGKDSLLFLASEFDKNHNALVDNVRDLALEVQMLKEDKETLNDEIQNLREQLSEINRLRDKEVNNF
ncbi:hypothetical protein SDC64_07640 [Acinetobacter haemolyticus]|uniref:hypothetical protein n=1 Tax=Acinetobacter haemolyticus TaxID=29430 RepID=UPI002A6B8B06|nr:hypothetical protein [Acinetobacter haemolyticus]WPO68782.1 hypothetical protein SDC64_07640 [Acinetobacter haemolyticus]